MANERLRRMFDQVRPSPEREEAMLAELLREEEREVRPMRRDWKRTAVLALIAAALLAAAALAVATVLDPAFLEHFGAGPKDEPLLGKTAVDVNLTAEPRELVYVGTGCTAGGPATEDIGTFFIRQAVVDRHSAKFLVDYTAPEGMVLDGDYYYPGFDYVLRGEEDWDITRSSYWVPKWEMVEDEDPTDGKITMLLTLAPTSGGDHLSGRRLLLIFRRLCAAENWDKAIRGERTVVVDGLWYFPMFTLPEEDPGVTYEIDQPVMLQGRRKTLEAVYVSPISLGFELSGWADTLPRTEEDWADSVALVTRKGERIPVVDASEMMNGYAGPESGYFYYRPERIIDPAEIKAVEFFGQTIDLK